MEEAAKLLGLSADQLNELRLKNEIFGTRDGNNWKFKMDEIHRFADDQGITVSGAADQVSDLLESGDEILLSDSGDVLGEDDDELSFGSSDIKLAAESSGNVLSGDEPASDGSPSDTGKMGLEVDEEELFDDDLLLQESASFEESSDLSSDFESSELLLDDSDSDGDVELDSADTGINLGPTDSGISLEEEPLELGGSDIDSLELPEDDEIISLEDAAEGLDSSSTDFGGDDDFNLTPLEDSLEDDISSGSQVIALEDSAIYTDDSAPTMLSEHDEIGQAALVAEPTYGEPAPATAEYGGGVMAYAPPEAPYSIWQVLSLFLAFGSVLLLTIVTIDLARNAWQPSEVTLSNSFVNFFLRIFGWDV